MNANLAWNDGNLLSSNMTHPRRTESCDFKQCYFLYYVHFMQVQIYTYLSWNSIYYMSLWGHITRICLCQL